MAIAVAVTRLHQCNPGLHRVQKSSTAGGLAAVVGHQQHGGADIDTLGHQACLLAPLDVTGQQRGLNAVADAQGATQGVALDTGRIVLGPWVQYLKIDPIPAPALSGLATGGGANRLQLVLSFYRAEQRGTWVHGQHRLSTAHMVAVPVTEQQRVDLGVHRAQQGHQHPVTRIRVPPQTRAGIKNKGVRGGVHNDGIALPDIGRQQLKLPYIGARRLPKQHRQQQGHAQEPHAAGELHGQKAPTQNTRSAGPQRRLRKRQGRKRHGRQPLQNPAHDSHCARCQVPQWRHQHTQHGQRRDHQRYPRNRQRIGHQAHHRGLTEQQQRQWRQSQRDHPLLLKHAPQTGHRARPQTRRS